MIKITLLGNTARLKQLIKEHGSVWLSDGSMIPKQCFNGDLGTGIFSLDHSHFRNVRKKDIKI